MKFMKNKLTRALPYIVLAASLVFVVGVAALWGAHNIDADQSSEMVLADLLNREGRLITDSWYYSTELRVISPVPLYQLGLLLFPGDWHAARVFALAIAFALVAAAMMYMARGAGLGESAVYAAAAVLLPVSEVHKFLFSLGGFYTMYIAAGALLVGLVLRAGRRGRMTLAAAAVLGFVCGLPGVRMPMICGVPMLAACLLCALPALFGHRPLREALGSESVHIALAACLAVGAMFAGYLVNTCLLAKTHHFQRYDGSVFGALSLSGFAVQLRNLAQYFGFRADLSPASPSGFAGWMMLGVYGFMWASLLRGLACSRRMDARARALLYTAAAALLLGMAINVAAGEGHNEYAVGYYLLGVFLLALSAFAHVEKLRRLGPRAKRMAMLALCGVFFLQSAAFVRGRVKKDESEYEHAARALVQMGYEAGYATFWSGNVLTEMSDGALDMYTFSTWADAELTPWLQQTRHFDAAPEGKVFVYVQENEFFGDAVPCADEARLIWQSPVNGSRAYGYDSAQEVMALQAAGR